MEESSAPGSQPTATTGGAGCLGEVGWFLSGTVLPMGSLAFYRRAAQRSVGGAILFFVVFTMAISTLVTINVGVEMFSVRDGIQESYADGEIPVITISDGIAEVDSEQPLILFSDTETIGERILVATDTSGRITQIDRNRFDQGFLLTRTELHMLTDQNGYQVVPLTELHDLFETDPIVIDADSVSRFWGAMSTVIVILVWIALVIWYSAVRLMIIATVALLLWGVVSLMRPNTGFGPVIITGLYAIVPAIYISHLFSRSNFSFPGLQTLFLLAFWTVGLAANFVDLKDREGRPMRLWTALIGVPMVILFVVDIFWVLPYPAGLIALWVVTALTGMALAGLRLYFRFTDRESGPPPVDPSM